MGKGKWTNFLKSSKSIDNVVYLCRHSYGSFHVPGLHSGADRPYSARLCLQQHSYGHIRQYARRARGHLQRRREWRGEQGICCSCWWELLDPSRFLFNRSVGPTDVGKSTLCRILCNYAVRKGRSPIFVDLDVGQNCLTVPGSISAAIVDQLADPVHGFQLEQQISYCVSIVFPI